MRVGKRAELWYNPFCTSKILFGGLTMANIKITPPRRVTDIFSFRKAVEGKFSALGIGSISNPKTGIVTAGCESLPEKVKEFLDTSYSGYEVEIVQEEGEPVEE